MPPINVEAIFLKFLILKESICNIFNFIGEAIYVNDIPAYPSELHGAFVLAEAKPFSKIKSIDAAAAKVGN